MGTQMDLVAERRDGSEVMVEIALSPLQDHGLPLRRRGDPRHRRLSAREAGAAARALQPSMLAQFGRLAVDARDPQVLLEQVPAIAAEALQVEMAMVFLLEPNGLELRVAGGVGLLPGEAIGERIANRARHSPRLRARTGPAGAGDRRLPRASALHACRRLPATRA